jgi:hypothetical protein
VQKLDQPEADKKVEVAGGQVDASAGIGGTGDTLVETNDGLSGHSMASLL